MTGQFLLDVNLLVALSWPRHEAHARAQGWFGRNAHLGWATCPMVQAGFVRVISNPAFSPHAVSVMEAVRALSGSTQSASHRFWDDDVRLDEALQLADARTVGHRQVTDLYLLGLAIRHRGKLATLDRRLASLLSEGSIARNHLEIV